MRRTGVVAGVGATAPLSRADGVGRTGWSPVGATTPYPGLTASRPDGCGAGVEATAPLSRADLVAAAQHEPVVGGDMADERRPRGESDRLLGL